MDVAKSGAKCMELPPAKVEWHLVRDGKPYGPLSEQEFLKFVELGHLESNDLLWRAGFNEWQSATIVFPELQKVLSPSHTDRMEPIIIGEPLVYARPPERRARSRKALVLALFLIVVLGAAASYACLRSDWYSTAPSPTSPEERDATIIRLGADTTHHDRTPLAVA